MIQDDQIAELRELANAALAACAMLGAPYPDEWFWRRYARKDIADYAARASPGVILALLDRLERTQDADPVRGCRVMLAAMDAEREALTSLCAWYAATLRDHADPNLDATEDAIAWLDARKRTASKEPA